MIEQIISDFADKHLCSGFTYSAGDKLTSIKTIFEMERFSVVELHFTQNSFAINIKDSSPLSFKITGGETLHSIPIVTNKMINLEVLRSSFDKNFSGENARRGKEVSFDDIDNLIDDVTEISKYQ